MRYPLQAIEDAPIPEEAVEEEVNKMLQQDELKDLAGSLRAG